MVCAPMFKLQNHGQQNRLELQKMTIIRYDNIDDLLPSEYQEPWPPLSDEEIEERQRQAEWDDYYNSIPDAAERNRNLK